MLNFLNVCNGLFECYSTISFDVTFLPEMNLHLYLFICAHYFLDRVEFFFCLVAQIFQIYQWLSAVCLPMCQAC